MSRYVLALDFGASSGRAMLSKFDGTKISLQEVHRFENEPIKKQGKLYWNFPQLMHELEEGLHAAYQVAPYESIGIDTWGVDYGILDKQGALLENPRHYRDTRTIGYLKKATEILSPEALYARTGTQAMEINTLFQLMSQNETDTISRETTMLLMPDLFAYFLTGTISIERSIASTTQMLSVASGKWDTQLLKKMGIPTEILPPIIESSDSKGTLLPQIQQRLHLPPIAVTAVCGHDTQCAVFATPAKTDKYIFLSCGTWSLFGAECSKPVLSPQAARLGLSNEVGYGKNITFLKNIIGLWLIQESRREYARQGIYYSFSEIESMAKAVPYSKCYIDPDNPIFTTPGNIPQRIQAYCAQTNQPVLQTPSEIFRCIYESLAWKYRTALEELETCTGETYPIIHLVGGGARDTMLCQLTATFCQRPVAAGPVEATVYGNAAIQFLSIGAIDSPAQAKKCIINSEKIQTYQPQSFPDDAYHAFLHVLHH